jgi:hypothetical protein
VLDSRIEVDLRLGRHPDRVGELRALLVEHHWKSVFTVC